jgi:hypothetical protein
MKKSTLSICLLISSLSFSQIPDYFPAGAVWNETYKEETGGDMSSDCGSVTSYNLSIENDVMLGSKMYKRMHKNGVLNSHFTLVLPQTQEFYNPACVFTVPVSDDYYVRQDGQKIYVYLTDTTEHLLYDFDMNVGDSFYYKGSGVFSQNSTDVILWQDSVQCFVDSISSISVDGSFRNIFYLSHDNYGGISGVEDTNSVFIEGIGNMGGFFCGISRFTEYTTRTLECFGINNISYWSGSNGLCDLSVGLKTKDLDINLVYFPNPVVNKMEIDRIESFLINRIEIIDLIGKKTELKFIINESNKISIDLSEFSSGIYFLKLIDFNCNEHVIKVEKE